MRSYLYPKEHRRHLRAANVVGSPFAVLGFQTDAAKRFKKVQWATAVIWKMLMPTRKRSRRLNAPQLLAKVCA